jgi:STE24 endopeptidase
MMAAMGGDPGVFSTEEVARAARYHRPRTVAMVVSLIVDLGVLGVLTFGPVHRWVAEALDGLAWWEATVLWAVVSVMTVWLATIPVAYWQGFVHEHRWGLSTQSIRGWLADRAKGLAIGLPLTSLALLGLVGLARWFPVLWPLAAGAFGALLVVVLSFMAPVVFEPLFNRFRPLPDPELAASLRELGDRAGVPVRDVLVADASRRTRKENAYVSGLGRTRRVVVYDTLLERGGPSEVELVVAHELGHRRLRHIAKGTALGMASLASAVVAVWALLRWDALLRAIHIHAGRPGDPAVVPFVLLAGAVLQLLAAPAGAALSRRWESAADRFSLELTGDLELFERSHRELALANLSDLAPPRWLYVVTFSHPTAPERIRAGRRWAAERAKINRAVPRSLPATQIPPTTGW